MNYKPLPKEVTIDKSTIHGLGLFAKTNIKPKHILGVTHIGNKDYENGYIRTPLGGFINHSDKPNVELIGCGQTRDIECGILKLQTLRHINKGEELVLKYSMYKIK